MKYSLWSVTLLLCFSMTAVRAEDASQAKTPPTAEIKTWHFEADTNRRSSVTLFLGETIDHVITKMGEPRSRSKKKKDPINQELRYVRKIRGPVLQQQARTRDGIATYLGQIIYTDEITLYFKNETLQNVKTYRTRSDEANQGLPAYMQ